MNRFVDDSSTVKYYNSLIELTMQSPYSPKELEGYEGSKNQFAQYELCFGNRFHVDPNGLNIKSTGFT